MIRRNHPPRLSHLRVIGEATEDEAKSDSTRTWRFLNTFRSGSGMSWPERHPRSGAGLTRASGPRVHRRGLGQGFHGARPQSADAPNCLRCAESFAARQVAREQGARAPESAPAVDRSRLARRQGPEDRVHAALDLAE